MSKVLFTILLLLFCYGLQAQEIIIKGTIINSRSNTSVAFANLGIEGVTVGTVSNVNGEYEFHLPEKHWQDTIIISCIGYYTKQVAISDISNPKQFKIRLRPRAYLLDQVTVRPADLSAAEIVQIAMRRIPTNYLNRPYMMDGFYREYFKENGKYSAFAEAAISIYDHDGYNHKKEKEKELIRLNQLRVSDIYNDGDYVLYIDLNYALRSNVLRNKEYWQWYADKARYHLINMEVDSITYYDGDLVYSISYEFESKRRGTYSGKFFVRTLDFAVLKLEIHADNRLKGRNINGAPKQSHAVMTFKEFKGKLYLNYINASHEVIHQTKNEHYSLTFFSELYVNAIQSRDVNPIPEHERMAESSIFYQPRYRTYDPNYWDNYTLFSESMANDSIVSDLERSRELEKQYKANGKLKVQKKTPPISGYNK